MEHDKSFINGSQFETKCPECGAEDSLHVTKVVMLQTGRTLEINIPLQPDGFAFDPNDVSLNDHSTTNEEVTCTHCNKVIPLSRLTN